jgi:hypothetical protein
VNKCGIGAGRRFGPGSFHPRSPAADLQPSPSLLSGLENGNCEASPVQKCITARWSAGMAPTRVMQAGLVGGLFG